MNRRYTVFVNAKPTPLVAILLAIASLTHVAGARAQLGTPPTGKTSQVEMLPSPSPNVLYDRLMHPDPKSQFSADEQRMDALDVLGIGGNSFQRIRLTYDDLDGDNVPEALFTIEIGDGGVSLVVLKQKGTQWYRLATPDEFSCWCKEYDSPLDSFAEVRPWSRDDRGQPSKLIFLRWVGGGTGGHERQLFIYTLQGFELKQAFHVTEERVACPPEAKCNLDHAEIRVVDALDQPHALLMVSQQRKNVVGNFWDDSWWIGLPIQACRAYTWNDKSKQFLDNRAATTAYCSHLGKPPTQAATR